jgi:sn1-specific diacylglycerol lipase
MDASLGSLASKLIVSFVYSHDVVSRLSLDHVRDIRNAALWLCDANDKDAGNHGEGYTAVIKRAGRWKAGLGSADDADWVSFVSFACLFLNRLIPFFPSLWL